MPIFPLWGLQATLRRRLGLIAVFAMGGGAFTVSLLRFIVLWQLGNTDDVTYVFGSVTLVTSVEFAVAVITANMPGAAAFWQHVRKHRSRGYGSGGADSEVRQRGCRLSGGAANEAALELETIGAKCSRKKYTLDSVLKPRYDNRGPRKTRTEDGLIDY